ncbi:MAG TPA: hypothetical protein VGA67_00510 [Candidatus Dojkabacteria bacterium]|jgi:hypothetical protein
MKKKSWGPMAANILLVWIILAISIFISDSIFIQNGNRDIDYINFDKPYEQYVFREFSSDSFQNLNVNVENSNFEIAPGDIAGSILESTYYFEDQSPDILSGNNSLTIQSNPFQLNPNKIFRPHQSDISLTTSESFEKIYTVVENSSIQFTINNFKKFEAQIKNTSGIIEFGDFDTNSNTIMEIRNSDIDITINRQNPFLLHFENTGNLTIDGKQQSESGTYSSSGFQNAEISMDLTIKIDKDSTVNLTIQE